MKENFLREKFDILLKCVIFISQVFILLLLVFELLYVYLIVCSDFHGIV